MEDTLPKKVKKPRKKNYINNEDFANVVEKWINDSKEAGERVEIPYYMAECFLKIVKGLGSKKNFSGYTYILDMKSEAIEHCVKYADRFNVEKSRNAFAYFTQISFNAFIQMINKEKKIAKLKFDMAGESMVNSHKWDRNLISSSEDKSKKDG